MISSVIPTDRDVLRDWISDFKARYGMAPIGGGESQPGAPAATPPPAAPVQQVPAPAPAPAPAAAQQPAAPVQQQPAPAVPHPGAQAQPGAEGVPAAEPMPQYAQELLNRMEQLAPPAQVDPLAVELGLVPQPPQPLPGQQVYDPSQAPQVAGLGQPGALPQSPAALPGQQAGIPGQPQAQPGSPLDPQTQLVEQYIDQRAGQVAQQMLEERVAPLFQQQEVARRRQESAALLDDYPELKDPTKGQALLSQARTWAQETLGDPRYAAEPGYLEMVHLAMKGLESARQGQVSGQAAPGGGEVPIEGPGGQAPGTVPTSIELAQQVVDAKPGGGLDPLWV